MNEAVGSLHRYYIQANRMRTLLDEVLTKRRGDEQSLEDTEIRMYLDLWFGCLMPVIEGWRELGLSDDRIDALLAEGVAAGYESALKRHRNGTFHFQRKYWDDRFVGFTMHGHDSARWVRELNTQLGRWFLETLRAGQQTTP